MITSHPIKTYNNTKLSLKDIEVISKQEPIWWYKSNWRQRIITLYQSPNDPAGCISIGIAFDESYQVIAEERTSEHSAFLRKQRVLE